MAKKRRGRPTLESKYPALTAAIEEKGMTQWQVAGATGVRRIGQKLAKKSNFTYEDVKVLTKFFDTPFEKLFEEEVKKDRG